MAGRGRPQGRQDIAPRIRAAFLQAIEQLKEKGGIADLADIFEEMLVNDPLRTLDTLAKYVPKEIDIDHDVTHRIVSGEAMPIEQWEAQHLEHQPEDQERTH